MSRCWEIPVAGPASRRTRPRSASLATLAWQTSKPDLASLGVDAQRRGDRLRSGNYNLSTTRCPVSSLSDVHTHIGRATGRASRLPHVKPEAAIAATPSRSSRTPTMPASDRMRKRRTGRCRMPSAHGRNITPRIGPRMLIFHRKSKSKTPNRPLFRQARATDRRPTPTSAGSVRPVPACRTSIPNVGRAHSRASHAPHVEPEARAARDAPRPSRVCRRRHAAQAGPIGTRTDGGGAATAASPVRPGRPGARLYGRVGGKLHHFGGRDQTGGRTFHG